MNHASIERLKDKTVNVLVVDDEPTVILLLIEYFSGFFSDLDINISTANNGEEALAKLLEQKFDLLITDYDMPKLNGLKLIEAVHALNLQQSMKVILITGGGKCSDISKALTLSDAHAFKPLDFDYLTNIISKCFNETLCLDDECA